MANQKIGLDAVLNLSQFQPNVGVYINSVNRMVSETRSAANEMNRVSTIAATGLGTAIGIAAAEIAGTMVSALQTLGAEVLETIRFFESLRFSLETMGALAQLNSGAAATLEEGLNNVTEAVQSQILALQERAIFSIFSTEELANAQKLLQVYGFLPDVASGINQILADAGSAFGWQPDVLIRVSRAIGQIRLEQRLLARDALQLTSAGVDVYGAIQRATGLTIDQINEMQRKSSLGADVAINAILTELNLLEGSGERATFTMQGLLSSLEDIRQISLRDLFSGVFEGFRPFLEEIVKFGASNEFKTSITVIGEQIGASVQAGIRNAIFWIQQLTDAWLAVPPSIQNSIIIFGLVATAIVAFAGAAGLAIFAIQALINPFTVATTIIAAFASTYSSNLLGVKTITEGAVSTAIRWFNQLGTVVSGVASEVSDVLSAATDSIISFMGSVADYGANIASSLASGMSNIVQMIVPVMDLITSTMTYFLAPGSPPRVLPDLEKWGTETANVWLSAWKDADFDILNDISGDVEKILKGLTFLGDLDDIDVPRTLMKLRPAIAEAINQIRHYGSVTEDVFERVERAAGPAAEQTITLLRRYTELAVSTNLVETAQNRLNAISEKYSAILEPIRKRLAAISEARRKTSEEREILALQRTINTAGIGALRKEEARLRIQEIQADRRVRGLETAQTVEEQAAEAALKAAELRQKAAESALSAARSQIDVQQEQLKLYGDEQRILEQLAKEAERLAKEAKKAFEEQLQKGVKIAKLLQDELKDTVETFRAQYTLQDATATAAEKTRAELELQAIAARKVVREYEAVELGVSLNTLRALRLVPVTLKDINKEGKDGAGRSLDDDFSQWAIDTSDKLAEFNKVMEQTRENFANAGKEFEAFVTRLDAMLPPFLKLRGEVGEISPIIQTFTAALAGVVAAEVAGRFITLTRALPGLIMGLSNPFSFVTTAIGLFAAAWVADWNGIRQKTINAINGVRDIYDQLFKDQDTLSDHLREALPSSGIVLFIQRNLPFLVEWHDALVDTFGPDILSGALAATEAALSTFISSIQSLIDPIIQGGLTTDAIRQTIENIQALAKQEVTQFVNSLSFDTQVLLLTLAGRIAAFFSTAWNPFLIAIARNLPLFGRVVATTFAGLGKSLGDLFPIVRNLSGIFLQFISPLGKLALGVLKGIPGQLLLVGDRIITLVGSVLAQGILGIVAAIGRIIDIRTLVQQIFSIPGLFRTMVANVISTILSLPGHIRSVFTLIYTIITSNFSAAWRFATNVFGIFVATFGANVQHYLNHIRRAFGPGILTRMAPVLAFFRTLGNVFGAPILRGLSAVGQAIQSIRSPANIAKLGSFFSGLLRGIGAGIGKGVITSFQTLFRLVGAFDLGAISKSALRFGSTMKKAGGLLGGFLNPLNLITFGIDFFAFAWNKDIAGVENGAKGLVANLLKFWDDLITGKLWANIVGNITPWIDRLSLVWSDFQKNGFNSTELRGFLRDLGTALLEWLQDTGGAIWESLRTFWLPVFWEWIKETAAETIKGLANFLLLIRDWVVAGGAWILDLLINHWIPAFVNWWTIGGGGKATGEFLVNAFNTIRDWIVTASVWIYDNFIGNWLPSFVNWIVVAGPVILERLWDWLKQIGNWILAKIPVVVDWLLNMAAAFVEWLGPVVKWTLENLGVWIGAILKWVIGTGIPLLLGLGAKLITALVSWIFDATPNAATGAKTGLQRFLEAVWAFFTENIIPGFLSFGKSIVEGIVAGLGELGQKAWESLKSGFEWALNALLEWLGIRSPSQWMIDNIGGPIVEGIVEGLDALIDNPVFKLIQEVISGGFDLLKRGATATFEAMTDAVSAIVTGFTKQIHDDLLAFYNEIVDMTEGLSAAIVFLIIKLGVDLDDEMAQIKTDMARRWDAISLDSRLEVNDMATRIVGHFETMRANIAGKMEAIKLKVIEEFTNMRTGSETQATLMRSNIVDTLVGEALDPTGNPTSLLGILAKKFSEQGTLIGEGFITGMATAIRSENSLLLLKEAIKYVIQSSFDAAKLELEMGSPSKRAAREIGLPWSQGAAMGVLQGVSQLRSAISTAIGSMLDMGGLQSGFGPSQSTFLPSSVTNISRSTTYQLNVSSDSSSQGLASDFAVIRSMAGT